MASPIVVVFHNIAVRASAYETEIGVTGSPERFLAQVRYFSSHYDVIDLATLLDGPLPKRPLLITFDDHFKSILTMAREVMKPLGLPAVLFANPDLFGADTLSLDNCLSWFAAKRGLAALQTELGLAGYANVAAIINGPMALMGATARHHLKARLAMAATNDTGELDIRGGTLTEADIRELVSMGFAIGNQTASHVHCRSLSADERHSEIVVAKQRIESVSGQPVRSFAVPYGSQNDLTPEVLKVLRESGHEAIFLVQARHNRFRPAADTWFRVSLHNEAVTDLQRKLEFLPVLRSIKSMIRPQNRH